MEPVGAPQGVQDPRDNHSVIVFADAQTVFAVAQIGVDPTKVGGVERVDCDGLLNKVEFIAADNVGFRACALVPRWPVRCAILFNFLKELVRPQVFEFDLDILGILVEPKLGSLHSDGGDGGPYYSF